MTFKKAVEDFVSRSNGFDNYGEMQLSWSAFTDSLARDNQITEKQRCNWGNPCTPETFKRWCNKWYGLRSNYESTD